MDKPSIFISGGAGGIGLATAKHFAARGWRVGIGDVNPAQLAQARAEGAVLMTADRHMTRYGVPCVGVR